MSLERGSLLNGRYRITDILGQGGMGAVYRAVDENIDKEVAVKENLYLSPEYTRQFRREAVILASLQHPSLPRVSDYFLIPGQGQYMVMDFIDGEDLRQRMERLGRIPEQDTLLIGAAMCDALTYLHTRQPPIIHRDIKPGNVKITPSGRIALVDFGLAKVMHDQQATTTGARAMTPGFSPPEQYGTGRTDPRTDIYSLAATLYTAVTGVIPEDGLARATGNAELTPIRKLIPEIGRRTASVIEKALEIEPDDRFQTAEEFKRELLIAGGELLPAATSEISIEPGTAQPGPEPAGALVFQSDTPAPAVTPPKTGRRFRTRPRRISSSWMAAILILLFGGGVLFAVSPTHLPASLAALLGRGKNATPTLPAAANSALKTRPPTRSPQTPTVLAPSAVAGGPNPVVPAIPSDTPAPATPTPTATPTGGGDGQIAFVSTRTGTPQIWEMDPHGNRQIQLTNVADGACQPSWSPDGTAIVFTSPCPGPRPKYPGSSLFVWHKDGTITPIPPSPEGDYDPAWSPDGIRIAFTSLRDGHPQIYLYNLADKSFKNLSNSVFPDHEPAWNPAGSQIAFIRTQTSDQVWFMGDNGSRQSLYSISGEFNDQYPVWSADGQMLFFGQTTPTGDVPWLMGLRYNDRGTSGEFRIPPKGQADPGPVKHPSVSPDGFWIVFEGWPTGDNHDIYRMSISGTNFQRLTTDRDLDFDPAWGPAPAQP